MIPLTEVANRIGLVAHSPDQTFARLIELAALDPTADFVGADLSEVDFGDLDVDGFNFSHADLTNANLSQVRNFSRANFDGATLRSARLPSSAKILPPTQAEAAAYLVVDELFELVIAPMATRNLIRLRTSTNQERRSILSEPPEYICARPSTILVQIPTELYWRQHYGHLSGISFWEVETSSRIARVPCILHEKDRFEARTVLAKGPTQMTYIGDLSIIGFTDLESVDRLHDIQKHSHQTRDELNDMCRRFFRYTTHRIEALRKTSRYPLQVIAALAPDEG